MILILDIDETLIHSIDPSESTRGIDEDLLDDAFPVLGHLVTRRPYLDLFIEKATHDPYYKVGVWSAGTFEYVHAIVDEIFPDKSLLEFVMTRDDCNEVRDKPLSKVRDRYQKAHEENPYLHPHAPTVHDFLIIDDRKRVTCHDELNHLEIRAFEGEGDDELLRLWRYLDNNRYTTSEFLAANWQ